MTHQTSEPSHWRVNGHAIDCPVCGGVQFRRSKAQLNTAGLSFLDLDFLNKTASLLVCAQCSHIHWFADKTLLDGSGL